MGHNPESEIKYVIIGHSCSRVGRNICKLGSCLRSCKWRKEKQLNLSRLLKNITEGLFLCVLLMSPSDQIILNCSISVSFQIPFQIPSLTIFGLFLFREILLWGWIWQNPCISCSQSEEIYNLAIILSAFSIHSYLHSAVWRCTCDVDIIWSQTIYITFRQFCEVVRLNITQARWIVGWYATLSYMCIWWTCNERFKKNNQPNNLHDHEGITNLELVWSGKSMWHCCTRKTSLLKCRNGITLLMYTN